MPCKITCPSTTLLRKAGLSQRPKAPYNAHILPRLGNKVIAELKTQHINKWLIDIAEAPKRNRGKLTEIDKTDEEEVRKRRASANRILTALKAALNHAYRAGRVASDDAWRRVSPFKRADAPKIRFLSTDECNRLLNAADPNFRPMVRRRPFDRMPLWRIDQA